ncbi:MAG: TlpA family protein disulfide reductase, partial [Burkholderiaceae bacterium]|nr:TlpA family protein disulfide reductase [Burkholderiaceae bacterium]
WQQRSAAPTSNAATGPSASARSATWPAKLAPLADGSLLALDGGPLRLERRHAGATVVNFWATWCAPCVEEMPELERLAQSAPDHRIVGIAIDSPSNVRQFLAKVPVGYSIGLAGLSGSDWMKGLGNDKGGLPFTLVIGADGQELFRKLGRVSEAELRSVLAAR